MSTSSDYSSKSDVYNQRHTKSIILLVFIIKNQHLKHKSVLQKLKTSNSKRKTKNLSEINFGFYDIFKLLKKIVLIYNQHHTEP